MARIRVVCIPLLLFALRLAAIPPAPDLDCYSLRVWHTQDGLPEETVQAFAQTPDRYLWVGASGGLVRFDGAQFVVFDRENTAALRENSVFSLLVSREGTLWIGTDGGGLVRYRHGAFRSYSRDQELTNGFVRAICEDRNGTLWVGTDDGLFRLAGDRLARFDGRGRVPALAVHAIFEDHGGRLWVGGSTLLMLSGDNVSEYRFT
ncbi:MAG: ligand-binding sensor domain-containing protein, partial [Bryobacteraceae bacterium]